jgi:hypothetical protein
MPAVSTLCLKRNKVLLKNQKNLIVLPYKIKERLNMLRMNFRSSLSGKHHRYHFKGT